MSNEDLELLAEEPGNLEELSDDDLEDVAGGWDGDPPPDGGG